MRATELRIGNFVYGVNRRSGVAIPDGQALRVLEIGLFNTEVLPSHLIPAQVETWIKVTNGDLSPIPLTPEWLERFGFKPQDQHKLDFAFPGEPAHVISKGGENGWYYGFENYQVHLPNIEIKYVHQLQNLFYVLTGEELTLTPHHKQT